MTGPTTERYPCPACGFMTFVEPPGSHEICALCGWQDDNVQLAHPRLLIGANGESLVQFQKRNIEEYPLEIQSVDGIPRDPEWRPATENEARIRKDGPTTGLEWFHALDLQPEYYWRKKG